MKIFRKLAAFLLTAAMLAGMAPQAEAAESSSYPVAPNALVKEIQAPVIVNKLIEGREPAEGESRQAADAHKSPRSFCSEPGIGG